MMSKEWDGASLLVSEAVAGDQVALGQIVRLTQRDIRRYISLHAGVGETDDLTQETYLRAIGALPTFEGRSSLRTWLLVIARRVVIDDIRRKMARPRTVSTDGWQELADHARSSSRPDGDGRGDLVDLELLLADLTGERREALVLTQVLGLTYQEAAEICRCPIGTVRSRVARGRADLLQMTRADDDKGSRAASY